MPALLTRMSMWPPPSSTALRASSRAGLAGQRGGDEVGLAAGGADALDGLVAAGGVSPGHDDVGAVQGQAGGGGAADAAVAAGDQGYRSGQVCSHD
jgi:hypothetical protein